MREERRLAMAGAELQDKVEKVEIIDLLDLSTTTVKNYLSGGINDNGLSLNCSSLNPNPRCRNDTADASEIEASLEVERLVRIIVPTIFGVIVLLGLLGNLLVILVVVSDKKMRNTTNILILSLAVADLLFIVFCVPFTAASYAMPVWPFGDVWCRVVQYLIYVSAYGSVYTLVLMSLDRYLAVVHAIRSINIRTECNTWLAVGVVWAVIMLSNIPLLFEYGILNYMHMGEDRSTCTNLVHVIDQQRGKIFVSCFMTFGYVVPLSVVCCLYGLMLKRLLYGVVPGGGNQSQESIRAKKRVTRMVIIVVIIFAVCWLPIQIILMMQQFEIYPGEAFYIWLQLVSNCLAYMNSCVNPFLYAFLSENFRRSFRKFLCCCDSTPATRRMDYERTNIRYNDKDTNTSNMTRTANNV